MRTTIDLPDNLYRSVKLKATEQGLTLKEFVVRGMETSLQTASQRGYRMEQPPIPRREGGATIPARSNRELAEMLETSGENKF